MFCYFSDHAYGGPGAAFFVGTEHYFLDGFVVDKQHRQNKRHYQHINRTEGHEQPFDESVVEFLDGYSSEYRYQQHYHEYYRNDCARRGEDL